MKKFLQKSCAWLVMLVAMFAMSMSAMATTVVLPMANATADQWFSANDDFECKYSRGTAVYALAPSVMSWGGYNYIEFRAGNVISVRAKNEGVTITKVNLQGLGSTYLCGYTVDGTDYNSESPCTLSTPSQSVDIAVNSKLNQYVSGVEVEYTSEGGEQGGGSSEQPTSTTSTLNFNSWNLTYSGGSSKPASATSFNNGEVFSNADGVTMTLTGIPATQSWPNECFYSNPGGSDMALYLANTEGFDIAAPTGKKISKIVVTAYNTATYPLTSLKADGVAFTTANNATWTGDATSVSFSTIAGNQNQRVLIQTITVTLVDANGEGGGEQPEPVVTYATFDYADPAAGTISLDDKPEGLEYFYVYFEEKLVADYGTYSGQTLPADFKLTDPNGDVVTFNYLQGWASTEWWDYRSFSFQTAENLTTPGTYTLHVPAGLFTFEGGKVNPELNLEWTLTAAENFEISRNGTKATGEEKDNGGLKTLTGFTISAPNGVTFDHIASDAKVQRTSYDENWQMVYTDVDATVTLNATDNTVSITFPTAYTEKANYSFVLTEGAIVATDGRTSKKVSLDASVDPMDYFAITADPADGSSYEGLLNTLKITVPAGVTVTGLSTTDKINFGGWQVDPTSWSQEGNVVTLVFPDDKAGQPGNQYFWYNIPQGLFITSDPLATNSSFSAYNINIKEKLTYMTVDKLTFETETATAVESGATVDKLSWFYIYFNEPLAEEGDVWDTPEGMTLTDANGTTYGWSYVYGFASDRYDSQNCVVQAKLTDPSYYVSGIKAAGTYTLHIPAGAYVSAAGHPSEEINYTFVIEDKEVKVVSAQIDDTEGGMGTATITFDGEVNITNNYPANGDVTLYKGGSVVDLENFYYVYLQGSGNNAYVYVYNTSGSTFFPLEAGDYTLRVAGKYFASSTNKVYSEAADIEIPFTVAAPADIAVSAESEGKFYATYYNGKRNWIVPAGVTAYWVPSVADGVVNLEVAANAGEVVNSSVAVLLCSNTAISAAQMQYTTENGTGYYNDNLLRGVTEDRLVENSSWDTQYTYYMLSKKDDGTVGFYWDPSTNDEGASINAKAHKAYLRVPVESGDAPSNLRISFGGEEPTGINAIIASEAGEGIFNLQGQRVNATAKGGVYVKGGKKIIVK